MDDYAAALGDYITNVHIKLKFNQLMDTMRYIPIPKARQNDLGESNIDERLRLVVYLRQFPEFATKEEKIGYLDKNDYVNVHDAGLAKYYKGGYESPWIHKSIAIPYQEIMKTRMDATGANLIVRIGAKWNSIAKRVIMWSPMLYYPQIASSSLLWDGANLRAFPKEFFTLAPRSIGKLFKGTGLETKFEALEEEQWDPSLVELMMACGPQGLNFSAISDALYDQASTMDHAFKSTHFTNAMSFIYSKGGVEAEIFNRVVPRLMYSQYNTMYRYFENKAKQRGENLSQMQMI
jgi:hypothetical protein